MSKPGMREAMRARMLRDDVANAEEDMKSLKDEISDDDITKPDYSRVTATTNQKDAKGAATNEEEEGAAAVMPGTVNEDEDDVADNMGIEPGVVQKHLKRVRRLSRRVKQPLALNLACPRKPVQELIKH
ncbi:uncharacterized protein PITG_16156 [Phytophthora infestans T30-4]|uniref:Uncharacterized protein n=1 Tax=Phytophthora infestans (strain T30-4) TaxID=403677 RepID=D0NT08_PHYIT|nr:uncharacterized protein PITG_16156 [Phytophthora infestans T30-4]EEY64720.1 conserved hypothetical protein [Phytophthora infestans T30-4]|eukprot:XP_002897920.1 conserved hypothetical protein [Phytophthora infestans T30-4]